MSVDEIKAEVATGDEPVAVPLLDEVVHVRPVRKWRSSAIRAVGEGNYDVWAETSLADGDYAIWRALDPDVDEANAFFDAWAVASGQTIPKPVASRRSSPSTATRSRRT